MGSLGFMQPASHDTLCRAPRKADTPPGDTRAIFPFRFPLPDPFPIFDDTNCPSPSRSSSPVGSPAPPLHSLPSLPPFAAAGRCPKSACELQHPAFEGQWRPGGGDHNTVPWYKGHGPMLRKAASQRTVCQGCLEGGGCPGHPTLVKGGSPPPGGLPWASPPREGGGGDRWPGGAPPAPSSCGPGGRSPSTPRLHGVLETHVCLTNCQRTSSSPGC